MSSRRCHHQQCRLWDATCTGTPSRGTQPFSRDGPWGYHGAVLSQVTSETRPRSWPYSWDTDPPPWARISHDHVAAWPCLGFEGTVAKDGSGGTLYEIFFWYPALKFWTAVERGHKKGPTSTQNTLEFGLCPVNHGMSQRALLPPWLQLLWGSFISLAAKVALKQNNNKKRILFLLWCLLASRL